MSQLNERQVKKVHAEETNPEPIETEKRSREKYLSLLNDMTHAILLAKDVDSTLSALAVNMAKLIDADDCYITRWDEEKQLTIPTATTAELGRPYSSSESNAHELSMTASVLKARRVLVAEDVFNSPYVSIEIAKQYPARSDCLPVLHVQPPPR